MAKRLFIEGKAVNVERIAEKTQAQFSAQLKQAGITISAERTESIYLALRHEEPVPAEVEETKARIKAEAEARAAQIKAEAQAKAKASSKH